MIRQTEIKPLTGIRGLAACWVVAFHYQKIHAVWPYSLPLKWGLLNHGYLAVDLFFVLSGFVMALSYGRFAQARWSVRNYGIFLTRRFARIYPVYFFVTCIILLLVKPMPMETLPDHDLLTLIQNFVLVQAWGLRGGG